MLCRQNVDHIAIPVEFVHFSGDSSFRRHLTFEIKFKASDTEETFSKHIRIFKNFLQLRVLSYFIHKLVTKFVSFLAMPLLLIVFMKILSYSNQQFFPYEMLYKCF